jgi:hypothetical protein
MGDINKLRNELMTEMRGARADVRAATTRLNALEDRIEQLFPAAIDETAIEQGDTKVKNVHYRAPRKDPKK